MGSGAKSGSKRSGLHQKGQSASGKECLQAQKTLLPALVLLTALDEDELQTRADRDNDSASFPLSGTPACLTEVCGRPLLQYTLDWLVSSPEGHSGVDEVILYATRHVDVIKQFLIRGGWLDTDSANSSGGKRHNKVTIRWVVNTKVGSVGEAMRDLYNSQFVRSDYFILLYGHHLIVNFDFGGEVDKLRQIRSQRSAFADKNAVMSVRLAPIKGSSKSTAKQHQMFGAGKSSSCCLTVATDVRTGKIRQFSSQSRLSLKALDLPQATSRGPPPCTTLRVQRHCAVHSGSLDVYICSSVVPSLFADNYDFDSMNDLIAELIDNDLLDYTVYCADYVEDRGGGARAPTEHGWLSVRQPYAASISSVSSWLEVTQDVMRRLAYPYVPDIMTPATAHSTSPEFNSKVFFDPTTRIYCHDVNALADSVKFGGICHVGQNVKLGPGSKLIDSYLGSNVSLPSGTTMTNCLVLDGVSIPDDGHHSHSTCILAMLASDGGDGSGGQHDGKELVTLRQQIVTGHIDRDPKYVDPVESSEEADSDFSSQTDGSDGEEGNFDVSGEECSDIDSEDKDAADRFEAFKSEVYDSLRRAVDEAVQVENLVLEINSSRHAYAVNATQVVISVVHSFVDIACEDAKSGETKQLLIQLKSKTSLFSPLLVKYCAKSAASQQAALQALASKCASSEKGANNLAPLMGRLLHQWFELDIVEESVILEWHETVVASGSVVAKAVQPFIDWLRSTDSDGDDDDDHDNESDDS